MQFVQRYGLALLIFAAAVVLRLWLDQLVPERLPFITFFPAVLLAAFFCGDASRHPCDWTVGDCRHHLGRSDRTKQPGRFLCHQLPAICITRGDRGSSALPYYFTRSSKAAGGAVGTYQSRTQTSHQKPVLYHQLYLSTDHQIRHIS